MLSATVALVVRCFVHETVEPSGLLYFGAIRLRTCAATKMPKDADKDKRK